MQNITTPEQGNLLIQCIYKGSKTDLGYGLLDNLGVRPGFEEGKFDGPFFEGGSIIFKFLNQKSQQPKRGENDDKNHANNGLFSFDHCNLLKCFYFS